LKRPWQFRRGGVASLNLIEFLYGTYDLLFCARFPCHRVVLSIWSDVFKTMFECLPKMDSDGRAPELPLEDTPKAIEAILAYCYSGKIEITQENVTSLLEVADKYNISTLVKACGDFLGDHITIERVGQILQCAQRHGATDAEAKCKHFLVSKFQKVCGTDIFLELDWDNFKWLLGRDELVCESEVAVFRSSMRWIEHKKERKEKLKEVLKLIRFTCFSAEDLSSVDSHPVALEAEKEYLRCLLNAYQVLTLPRCSTPPEKRRLYFNFKVSGVLRNLPLSVLEAQGWTLVYHQPYSHSTTESEIRAAASGYSHVLVGAKRVGSKELELCAAGRTPALLTHTTGRYDLREENGAYWYMWPGKAFGFSQAKQVDLFWADVCQTESESRLSWVIDGRGGWRVGKTFLYDTSESIHSWEKVLLASNEPLTGSCVSSSKCS